MRILTISILAIVLTAFTPVVYGANRPDRQAKPRLVDRTTAAANQATAASEIAEKVRYQLVTLSTYGVFDWIVAEILPNDSVVLRGEVTRPETKSDAEARIAKLEGISKVQDKIDVLPISPTDDAIRIATYRRIFRYDGPLFRYALPALPPIHIIVDNGRVTLKGAVSSEMDRQLAYVAARDVPGVLDVKNDLKVETTS